MRPMKWVSRPDERPSPPSFQLRRRGRRDTSSARHRLKHFQLMTASNVIQLHHQHQNGSWRQSLPSRRMLVAAEWFAEAPTPIRCCPPRRSKSGLCCPTSCTTGNIQKNRFNHLGGDFIMNGSFYALSENRWIGNLFLPDVQILGRNFNADQNDVVARKRFVDCGTTKMNLRLFDDLC